MPASENPVDPRYPATAGGDLAAYPVLEGDITVCYYVSVAGPGDRRTVVCLSAADLRDFAVACIGMVAQEESRV